VALLLVLGFAPQAAAQITLSQDFDSGSLNVEESVVSGTEITLEPRRFYGVDEYEWGGPRYRDWNWDWVFFRATGVQDESVSFRIPLEGSFLDSYRSEYRYLYSYDSVTWFFFDAATVDSTYYNFSNDAPFTEDEVYVAVNLPYTVQMTTDHTSSLRESPFVSRTASGDENFVIGRSAGGIDDLGRTISPQDIYAYMITDIAAAGSKVKIVLMAGNHSGEHLGNYLLQGMVDFLISSDPSASELRELADFYVYPQVDPDGRWAGYFRSNPENPELNHNRYWDDPTGFTDITIVRDAMLADTEGEVEVFFDCHDSGIWPTPGLFFIPTYSDPIFLRAIADLEPSIEHWRFVIAGDYTHYADGWALSSDGLNARYAYVPEPVAIPREPAEYYFNMGQSYMLALLEGLRASVDDDGDAGPGDADADVDESVDASPDADGGNVYPGGGGCGCSLGASNMVSQRAIALLLFPLD